MPLEFKIFIAIAVVIVIAIPLIFLFVFWLPNYKSIMRRAKEIDPSVKTFADAQFVLQKNVMQSINKNSSATEQNNADSDENNK